MARRLHTVLAYLMAFDTDPIEAEAAIVIDGDAPVTEAAVQGERRARPVGTSTT